MQIVMSVVFLVWTVIASQNIYNVKTIAKGHPVLAERYTWKCIVTYSFLAYMSVHYFGWLMGIIYFFLIFFGVIRCSFGWVFVIYRLLNIDNRMEKAIHNDLRFSIVAAILYFGVLFASYWYVDKGFLRDVVSNNLWIIAVFIGAVILGLILNLAVKFLIAKRYMNMYE